MYDVTIHVERDDSPDVSYLEQPEFEARKVAFALNEFHHVGVHAVIELYGPGYHITIKTDTLWSIESDCGDEYFRTVAADQVDELPAEVLRMIEAETKTTLLDVINDSETPINREDI